MDLKNLNTFKTVVAEGSFTKAAEKLNYTQSTITFQIGQLEQELSVRLFEKVGRRMVITKAGEQLIPYVDEILQSVNKLGFFKDNLAECEGSLKIGVAESQLCFRLPPILKRIHTAAPKAQLFLHSMNCYEIRDALLDGGLDVGIFYSTIGGIGNALQTYSFGEHPLVLVGSPATAAQYPNFTTPNQHIPIPFVINEPHCVFREFFEDYLTSKSIRMGHTIELGSIPTIKNLVQNDVGVTFLPRFAVEDELTRGTLVEIPTKVNNAMLTAVCAHHKNKWVSPLMQLFLDECANFS